MSVQIDHADKTIIAWQRSCTCNFKKALRKEEPGVVMPDRATRFEKMLETAIMGGALSWPQAARIAGVREQELRERLLAAVSLPGGNCMN